MKIEWDRDGVTFTIGEYTFRYPRSVAIVKTEDLIAVLELDPGKEWGKYCTDNCHWRYFADGIEAPWEDLTDEQRMRVRAGRAWGKRTRRLWEMKYKDDGWYAIEALESM